MAVRITMLLFWVLKPFRFAGRYQRFGKTFRLHPSLGLKTVSKPGTTSSTFSTTLRTNVVHRRRSHKGMRSLGDDTNVTRILAFVNAFFEF